jgi:hypothetical protein
MNKVEIRAEDLPLPYWAGAADNFVKSVLRALGQNNWDVSLLLCMPIYR